MNVRIDEEGVRFRITLEDLAVLMDGAGISHQILNFGCSIVPSAEAAEMRLSTSGQGIVLIVPQAALERLREMGRSKDGLIIQQDGAEIAIQVDLKSIQRAA